MTDMARRRLVENYQVDDSNVVVIPHGGALVPDRGRSRGPAAPLLMTWGLLGPGSGIERVVDALAELRDLDPAPNYLVVGQTHPRVLLEEGEAYRTRLVERAERKGVADLLTFRSAALDTASLQSLIALADVVVLPYDRQDESTSAVLIEAVTAGRPVVATAFAHAVELLGSGAGVIVDDEPEALVAAIRRVLGQPAEAAAMIARGAEITPDLIWPAVAARYRALADDLATIGSSSSGRSAGSV
jgi:glycosyltransferase involved in cell wall biosynthesis